MCLDRTKGKDNRVRLRMSSRTIGEDGSKPNPNPNPNANPNPNPSTKPNPKKETKEGNLEKGKKLEPPKLQN